MSNTTKLPPFQPVSITTALLAAVSFPARYAGHTHELYSYRLRRWFQWCEANGLDPLIDIRLALHPEPAVVVTFVVPAVMIAAGLRTTRSSAAVLATPVEPVTAALLAAVVLNECIGTAGVIGVLFVLAAVASIETSPRGAGPAGPTTGFGTR